MWPCALCRAVKRDDDATQPPEHVKLAAAKVPNPAPLGYFERRQSRTDHEDAAEPRRIDDVDPQYQTEQHERLNDERSSHKEESRPEPSGLEKTKDGIPGGKLRENVRNEEESADNAKLNYGVSEIRKSDGVNNNLPAVLLYAQLSLLRSSLVRSLEWYNIGALPAPDACIALGQHACG